LSFLLSNCSLQFLNWKIVLLEKSLNSAIIINMYSTGIAYLLWLLSGCGALGFHRFYLGKIPTGILWMCTGGLGMVGSIYDFLTLPGQVREANIRNAIYDQARRQYRPYSTSPGEGRQANWRYANDAEYKVMGNKGRDKEHPERVILRLARDGKGILTVSEVALAADISVDEAKKYLDKLVSKGFAELRVRKSGSLVYVIPDMIDKDEPLEDF
jgi:TM2 domain-containing membrane protein YozV/predicted transcriptional regulator